MENNNNNKIKFLGMSMMRSKKYQRIKTLSCKKQLPSVVVRAQRTLLTSKGKQTTSRQFNDARSQRNSKTLQFCGYILTLCTHHGHWLQTRHKTYHINVYSDTACVQFAFIHKGLTHIHLIHFLFLTPPSPSSLPPQYLAWLRV